MSRDLNKVYCTGRLGADPVVRQTPQGHTVATFRIAANRTWRSSNGVTHEDTEWFRVVAWNTLASRCQAFLRKGARVYVEGRLQTRQWRDDAGFSQSVTEVIAADFIVLTAREDAHTAPAILQLADTSP